MQTSFGHSWADHFESFDRLPFAAASIGQVHRAVLNPSSSPTGLSVPVAVKIQFPNIVNSIESDIGYVKMLLTAGRLLPRGLFLDKTIQVTRFLHVHLSHTERLLLLQVMKQELADECDYKREASFLRKFGSDDFLGRDSRFKVPWVWDRSTESVLVMERVEGSSVGGTAAHNLSQQDRDDVCVNEGSVQTFAECLFRSQQGLSSCA
jgi:aarF domain-containing kinase